MEKNKVERLRRWRRASWESQVSGECKGERWERWKNSEGITGTAEVREMG